MTSDELAWVPSAIPLELRERPQWVNFKFGARSGAKPAKIPYQSNGRGADVTRPDHWSAFSAVVERWSAGKAHGFGFAFSSDDPYVGVDLDNCRDPVLGTIDEWALAIISQLDSYAEISVSGTGVHCIVRAKHRGGQNRVGKVEVYDAKRYFTMTGQLLEAPGARRTICSRQASLDSVVDRHLRIESTTASDFSPLPESTDRIGNSIETKYVDAKIKDLLRRDGKFAGRWQRTEPGPAQKDFTPSGWLMSIANSLLYKAWDEFEVELALKLNAETHEDSNHHNDEWFRRTIRRAADWVRQNPAHKLEPDPELLATACQHVSCLIEHPEAFPLLLRLVEASRDGGRSSALSLKEAARLTGRSADTISRWYRHIRQAGCAGLRVRANGTSAAVHDLYLDERVHPDRSKMNHHQRH